MCGIAAIIGDITPKDKTNIQNMVSAQLHRGPDGNNIFEGYPIFFLYSLKYFGEKYGVYGSRFYRFFEVPKIIRKVLQQVRNH